MNYIYRYEIYEIYFKKRRDRSLIYFIWGLCYFSVCNYEIKLILIIYIFRYEMNKDKSNEISKSKLQSLICCWRFNSIEALLNSK